MSTTAEIRKGIGDSWTVALGLIPLGLAFGLLMTQVGFAWWWTPVFSIIIYAGSMEFLAISLVTGGIAPLSAVLYGFLVNFRHVFYGLSYPVSAVRSPVAKAYGIYSLTDETYAILSSKRAAAWTQPRVMAVQLFCQSSWVIPGTIGALAGSALPVELEGLDFALTALFVVLAIEAMDVSRDIWLPTVAAVAGMAAYLISESEMLLIGLSAYFVYLVGRYFWQSSRGDSRDSRDSHDSHDSHDSRGDGSGRAGNPERPTRNEAPEHPDQQAGGDQS